MTTLVLPISRTDYLRPVFNCLAELERPNDTELLIITDGNRELEKAVERRLDSINYSRVQIISFGEAPEIDRAARRFRISEIHNKAKQFVPEEADFVFLVEDDTTYPAETLTRFLRHLDENDSMVYVEGVQLGRRNTPYIGAWKTDDINDPHEFLSIMPSHGLQEIDAGGFYCALVEAELYKEHHFEPFDKQGKNGLSCDVNFGLYLRRMGFKCYVDHKISCDHIGDKGSVNLGNTKPRQVRFEKLKDWTSRTL